MVSIGALFCCFASFWSLSLQYFPSYVESLIDRKVLMRKFSRLALALGYYAGTVLLLLNVSECDICPTSRYFYRDKTLMRYSQS
jgi:hypothetical protein